MAVHLESGSASGCVDRRRVDRQFHSGLGPGVRDQLFAIEQERQHVGEAIFRDVGRTGASTAAGDKTAFSRSSPSSPTDQLCVPRR
jgi:hypothetical protein